MAVLVLAGSLREANAYGREKGLRIRFATGPEVIQAAKSIVELPSFRARRDRFAQAHALAAVLKYRKNVNYLYDTDWVMPKRVVSVIQPDNDEQARRERLIEVANRAVDALAGDLGITPEELIQQVAADFDKVKDVTPQVETLPIEVEEPKVEPKPAPRKRAAKKLPAPPVVAAPVEF